MRLASLPSRAVSRRSADCLRATTMQLGKVPQRDFTRQRDSSIGRRRSPQPVSRLPRFTRQIVVVSVGDGELVRAGCRAHAGSHRSIGWGGRATPHGRRVGPPYHSPSGASLGSVCSPSSARRSRGRARSAPARRPSRPRSAPARRGRRGSARPRGSRREPRLVAGEDSLTVGGGATRGPAEPPPASASREEGPRLCRCPVRRGGSSTSDGRARHSYDDAHPALVPGPCHEAEPGRRGGIQDGGIRTSAGPVASIDACDGRGR